MEQIKKAMIEDYGQWFYQMITAKNHQDKVWYYTKLLTITWYLGLYCGLDLYILDKAVIDKFTK